MTDLATKTIEELCELQATAIEALSDKILDFSVGSVENAFIESNAGLVFWLQDLIVKLLAVTRLATSAGIDVDSFIADFGLSRLTAVAAYGDVSFSRSIATDFAVVPVGARVQTVVGKQTFEVYADTNNVNYSAEFNGYTLLPGTLSISVPVRAIVVGSSAGNVAANTITLILQGIPGVSNVNNPLAFTNGEDQETDTQVMTRFLLYIQSLSKATKQALEYAIASIDKDIIYRLVENKTTSGVDRPGYFYAVVSKGGAVLPSDLELKVSAALDATRAFTIAYSVESPTFVPITISMSVSLDPDADYIQTTALIRAAISKYVATLGFNSLFPYNILPRIVFDSSPYVNNVKSILLNGGVSDLQTTNLQEFTVLPSNITITYI